MTADAKTRVNESAGVAWVFLDHPARRNAITVEMWEQLAETFTTLGGRSEIRAAVIAGAGEQAFASGADIESFQERDAQGSGESRLTRATRAAWLALDRFDKPLIAMIHGYCMGAGVAIASKADVRIAASTAQFAIPAARLGLAYPMEHIRALVAQIGPSAAKLLLFSAQRIDAGRALQIGLVDEVVDVTHLKARVQDLVTSIVDNAPLTLAAAKASIDLTSGRHQDEAKVLALINQCMMSADHVEGVQAFLGKRKPVFSGR
jgi:enoyl-CoA hydratase